MASTLPSLCLYRIFAMFDIFCSGLLMSTFHWFTSSGPPLPAKLTHFITQNASFQALAPDKNIPAAFYTTAFLQRPLHPIHNLFLPHSQKSPKLEPLLFSKNWQLYFHWFTSSAPLCSETYSLPNPKHVIQALAPAKNIPAAFYTKSFLQRPLHPIHNLLLPTARKPKSRVPSFSKNWQL